MLNEIRQIVYRLFNRTYIDLAKVKQTEKNGLIPVFCFFKINHFGRVLKDPVFTLFLK